jgi:hypothetical protein
MLKQHLLLESMCLWALSTLSAALNKQAIGQIQNHFDKAPPVLLTRLGKYAALSRSRDVSGSQLEL